MIVYKRFVQVVQFGLISKNSGRSFISYETKRIRGETKGLGVNSS